ncbi:PREDICTED: uncharacterized protein LOC104811545 [Tarenaya hassleriana]|uniref:uncharacterized protein LOC104811545 n=1 Tax=Tarenaya hassleriana TaxID=28532 RepID=UPI00053C7FD9|nr:PREDICTED: uncharacterized protein LOC104811545 [Tarenaya hassleriana]
MATTAIAPPSHLSVHLLRAPLSSRRRVVRFSSETRTRRRFAGLAVTRAVAGPDLLGDFGARDPFPEEIASNFGEKVLGCTDTEHKILIPNASALSLSQQTCSPVSPSQPPMSVGEAKELLRKVLGWRLLEEEGGLKMQTTWKVRDSACGAELMNRIQKVAEAAGHCPALQFHEPNQVQAILWTSSIGGLSMNDFIVAAKIDEIKTSDLAPRKRAWA